MTPMRTIRAMIDELIYFPAKASETLPAIRQSAGGLTQRAAAELVGVTAPQWSGWESGKTEPEPATMLKIAVKLGLAVEVLNKADEPIETIKPDGRGRWQFQSPESGEELLTFTLTEALAIVADATNRANVGQGDKRNDEPLDMMPLRIKAKAIADGLIRRTAAKPLGGFQVGQTVKCLLRGAPGPLVVVGPDEENADRVICSWIPGNDPSTIDDGSFPIKSLRPMHKQIPD